MGESQRKDGKYEYKYQDARGKRKTVYSWKLTPSDRVPAGKRNDISLREKEKQIHVFAGTLLFKIYSSGNIHCSFFPWSRFGGSITVAIQFVRENSFKSFGSDMASRKQYSCIFCRTC